MTCRQTLLSLAATAALAFAPSALAQGSPGGMGSGTPSSTGSGASTAGSTSKTAGKTGSTDTTGNAGMGKGGATATGSPTGGGTTGGSMGTTGGSMGTTGGMEGAMGDKEILSHLHMANQQEIEMGKLGKAHGTSKAVKDYGDQMVRDHSNADRMVSMTASKEKVKLEKTPATDAEKADHKAAMDAMDRLKKLKGAEFDREFMTQMSADHDKVISMVQSAQASATGETKTLLDRLLPQLQQHQQRATEIQGTLK